MDRSLSPDIIRRRRWRNAILIVLALVALTAIVWFFRNSLNTRVDTDRIRTAVAETGNVENTLSASGEIIPAFEQIITSPIRASIRRVISTPGARMKPGEAILELDKSLSEIELEKLKDQLALKRNGIDKLRMQLNKELYDAEIENDIKSLNINRLKAELEDTRRLFKVGGRTQEDVTRAENALKIAELEKKQLENNLKYSRQSMGANLKESELQAQIEEKNLSELQHKLKMADIVADRPGVLTWVNENIGAAVNEGEMLAKLADLGSFRVDGSAADSYAGMLQTGLPVIVRINDTDLRGLITQLQPSVENGIVRFSIQLDDPNNAALRPNMKVEVFVVTERVDKTVRVANGPAFNGRRNQVVFVLGADGIARRREVQTGLSNFDFVEIKSGIQPGERVIISDMSRFEHLREITIRQ